MFVVKPVHFCFQETRLTSIKWSKLSLLTTKTPTSVHFQNLIPSKPQSTSISGTVSNKVNFTLINHHPFRILPSIKHKLQGVLLSSTIDILCHPPSFCLVRQEAGCSPTSTIDILCHHPQSCLVSQEAGCSPTSTNDILCHCPQSCLVSQEAGCSPTFDHQPSSPQPFYKEDRNRSLSNNKNNNQPITTKPLLSHYFDFLVMKYSIHLRLPNTL